MAIRWDKDKVRAMAAGELARHDPDEQPLVTFHATAWSEPAAGGSGPGAQAAGLARRMLSRNCFLSLTPRHVVLHLVEGAFRTRLVEHSRLALGSEPVPHSVRRGGLARRVRLAPPGGETVLACEVVRYWWPELERFLAGLAPARQVR